MNTAVQIANYFVQKAEQYSVDVTQMHLLKLCFFAEGWYLGSTGYSLFEDEIQAWKLGPVIPTVYDAFKHYGASKVLQPAIVTNGDQLPKIVESAFLDAIWDLYGCKNAYLLSELTHVKASPWVQVYTSSPFKRNLVIPRETIKNYYREQLEDAKRRKSA